MIGTEHEYSINDENFNPLPVSDKIIQQINGKIENEILFGDVILSKELQKTVIEFVPKNPSDSIMQLECQLYNGITKFYQLFGDKYRLMGLGMHPILTLDKTSVWDWDEVEYYNAYDRLFNLKQHGWLNIQALQVNFSYSNDNELVILYNKIRALLPYIIALTASSPMVEGEITKYADNRLLFYRENQREIPAICNRIIPERLETVDDYYKNQECIFDELKLRNADILCGEWVNSSGIIIRFTRNCIEIKAMDEQESIHSDMAVCAFIQALLRCPDLIIPYDQKSLLLLTEVAIQYGTARLKDDLEYLYACAWKHATDIEKLYLPVVEERILKGSLSELIKKRYMAEGNIINIMRDMAVCLKENTSYTS